MFDEISSDRFEPAYLRLHRSGELIPCVERTIESLRHCRVCPRDCDVDRLADEKRVCKTGALCAHVASYSPHRGEENYLRGSGTIFVGWCNLRCSFCQNFDISQEESGIEVTAPELAVMMLDLQDPGCHNINFATPEHVVPQMLGALLIAGHSDGSTTMGYAVVKDANEVKGRVKLNY